MSELIKDKLTNKEEFIKLLRENVKRDGLEDLINYLENDSSFFVEPASTQYHGSYDGGLVDHSINVYYCILDELKFIYGKDWQKKYSLESATIVSLLHDICKIGRYVKGTRNVKTESGVWQTIDCYKYNDNYFTMGHASLSIHRIEKFMKLTDEEAQAIYWHMGAFDVSNYSSIRDLSEAYSRNTLAFALHRADMAATHLWENEKFKPLDIE